MTIREVVRHWGVYCLGAVAGRLASFLLLPVYTRFLSPADYGIKAMVMVGADIVGLFLGLGVAAATTRFYWGDRQDGPVRPEAISTGLLLSVGLFGIGAGAGLCWSSPLAALVFGDAAYAPFLQLGLIGMFFNNVIGVPLTYLMIRRRSGTFFLATLGTLLTSVGLNVVFVIGLGWGVNGILYSDILTYAIFSVPLIAMVGREVGWEFSPRLARAMLRYGAPLSFVPLAWLVINRADLRFLTHYGSLSAVGIYALAGQLAFILLAALVQPFENVWGAGQFELDREANASELFARVLQIFLALLLFLALALSVFAEEIVHTMAAPVFWPAASLLPALVGSYVLIGAAVVFRSGLLITNRTSAIAGIALATATVSLAVNAVLVPRYLEMGAALAKVGAALVLVGLTYLVVQRVRPRNFELARAARAVACAVLLFGVSRALPTSPWPVVLTIKVALVAALLPLCAWSYGWPLAGVLGGRWRDWRSLAGVAAIGRRS